MTINKSNENGKLTFVLEGRLDTNSAPELEASFNGEGEGVNNVILDFLKLDYLSSAGLRVILGMQKKMNASDGEMTVKNVNETIMEVFEITGFSDILTIE